MMWGKFHIYEPDGRYVGLIEVEDPFDAIIGHLLEADYHLYNKQSGVIENAPTIEAEPVKHGKWINDNNQTRCSICGKPSPLRKVMLRGAVVWECDSPANYCPNCGALMDIEEDNWIVIDDDFADFLLEDEEEVN